MTTKAEKCRVAKAVLLRSDASFKADFNGIEMDGGTSGIVIRQFNNWVLVSNSKGVGWMPDMFAETISEATTQKANEAASVKARAEALSGVEEEMSQLAQKEAAVIKTAGRCCELEAKSSELIAKLADLEAILADKKQELEASESIHIQPKSLRQKSNTRQLLGKLLGRTSNCFDDSASACQAVVVKARDEALSGVEEEMSQLAQKEAAVMKTAGRWCELEAKSSELIAKLADLEARLADKKQELEASENIHIQPKSLRQKSNTRQLLGKLLGRTFNCFDDSASACQAVAVKDLPEDSDVLAMGA